MVTAGWHLGNHIERKGLLVDRHPAQKGLEHGQALCIDNDLFIGDGQPTIQPAHRVHNKVGVRHHCGPERPHCFIGGLGIGYFGGVEAAAAAIRQVVVPRQLRPNRHRPGPFGGAKGGRTAFHVNVRGKAAIENRRAGAQQLDKGDPGQRFGVLLCHRGGNCNRAHRASEDKGGDDQHLSGPAKGKHPTQHAVVITQGAAGVDNPPQHGIRQFADIGAKGDICHLHGIAADDAAVRGLHVTFVA